MTSVIAKLRKDFLKEKSALKDFKPVRVNVKHEKTSVEITNKKMTIDAEKLERTIQKAVAPIKRKEIIVIDFVPETKAPEKTPVVFVTCKALNLNGTPCKFRAKCGQFCAKHAP